MYKSPTQHYKLQPLRWYLAGIFLSSLYGLPALSAYTVKENPKAGTGACLPEPTESPVKILNKLNVKYPNAVSRETAALGKIMSAINKIGDGRFTYHRNAHYVFKNEIGKSGFYGGLLQIRGNSQNLNAFAGANCHDGHCHSAGGKNNNALLVHELGHYIGHQAPRGPVRGSTLYTAYANVMGGEICEVSKYASNRKRGNHEEFAEVFAAYVTNPELLASRLSCRKSVAFFSQLFGEPNMPTSCMARQKSLGGRGVVAALPQAPPGSRSRTPSAAPQILAADSGELNIPSAPAAPSLSAEEAYQLGQAAGGLITLMMNQAASAEESPSPPAYNPDTYRAPSSRSAAIK